MYDITSIALSKFIIIIIIIIISWDLTVANIGLTWVKNNLNNIISLSMARNTDKQYIRYLFIVEDEVWPGPYATINKTNTMPISNISMIEKFTECRYTCDLQGYQ